MLERKQLENHIIQGDSLQVLKDFPSDSINLIVTSPPYWACRVYGNGTLGREKNPLDYVDNLFPIISQCKRVLSADGSLYLNIGDLYFNTSGYSRNTGSRKRKTDSQYKERDIVKPDGKYLQYKQLLLLPSRLAILMQEDGWILRNSIIWRKTNPLPNHSPDRRLPVYEYIFHFVKSRKYYFDYDMAKKLGNYTDIMETNVEAFQEHLATFPERLIHPLIMTTSKPNDLVLDPFMGAGTVAVVCKKNQRHYVGIELVPENVRIAERRIKDCHNLFE